MIGGGPCRAHPSDPDVFFTKGPNDWTIRKWIFGGKPAYVDLNVMGGFPGGRPPDGMFAAMSLAIDRRHPEVMYVMNAWDGVPNKFFRTIDGGAELGEHLRGLPRHLHARARGLADHRRGLHRLRRTARACCRRPTARRRPPARRRPSVWGQRFLDRPTERPRRRAAGGGPACIAVQHPGIWPVAGAGVRGSERQGCRSGSISAM